MERGRGRLGGLEKGRPISGAEREKIGAWLRERYAQGATIRELMAETGRSDGWTHRLLRESGAQLRGRGGAWPRRAEAPAAAGPVMTAAGVRASMDTAPAGP